MRKWITEKWVEKCVRKGEKWVEKCVREGEKWVEKCGYEFSRSLDF